LRVALAAASFTQSRVTCDCYTKSVSLS